MCRTHFGTHPPEAFFNSKGFSISFGAQEILPEVLQVEEVTLFDFENRLYSVVQLFDLLCVLSHLICFIFSCFVLFLLLL